MSLTFTREDDGAETAVPFTPTALVIAGWAGRDAAAVRHHIDELAALGVPAPSSVPLFYRVAHQQVSGAPCIEAVGPESSGEVEPVLIAMADGLWVGVGSDHTDRRAEAISVALAKQLCAKPLGRTLWRFDSVAAHWDRLILRSWAISAGVRRLYQEGSVAGLLPPLDLVRRLTGGASLPTGMILFCGTIPTIGAILPAESFEIELVDPVRGRSLRHCYRTEVLPVIA